MWHMLPTSNVVNEESSVTAEDIAAQRRSLPLIITRSNGGHGMRKQQSQITKSSCRNRACYHFQQHRGLRIQYDTALTSPTKQKNNAR